jgi:hypothetical protein
VHPASVGQPMSCSELGRLKHLDCLHASTEKPYWIKARSIGVNSVLTNCRDGCSPNNVWLQ